MIRLGRSHQIWIMLGLGLRQHLKNTNLILELKHFYSLKHLYKYFLFIILRLFSQHEIISS